MSKELEGIELQDKFEAISARIDALRDLIAGFVISATYKRPDIELSATAAIKGTFVEAAGDEFHHAYLDELREIGAQVQKVLDSRKAHGE